MPSFHKIFAIAAFSAIGLGAAVFAQDEFNPEQPVPSTSPRAVETGTDEEDGVKAIPFGPAGTKTYDPNPNKKRSPEEAYAPAPQSILRMVPVTRTVTEYVMQNMAPEEVKAVQGYYAAANALKIAQTDEDRAKARAKLNEEVEKLFQRDLDQREKQVAEAESRVKKLRDQLEKRKAAQKQIVDLRVQTLFNDASGLGFSLPFEPVEGAMGSGPTYGGGKESGPWNPQQLAPSYSKPRTPTLDRNPIEGKPTFKRAHPDHEHPTLSPTDQSEDQKVR